VDGGGGGLPDASADAGLPDAGGGDAGPFVVGAHQVYPVVPTNGGPVLASPKLVTVTFAADPQAGGREAFDDWVIGSQWYAAWSPEYGVMPATHLARARLNLTAPTSVTETSVGSMLLDLIADGGLPGPSAGDVLYEVYLPPGTSATFGGAPTCFLHLGVDFVAGFHWEATRGATRIPFAVVPYCADGGISESDGGVEFSASHELAEGCTDPFPLSATAYQLEDGSAWSQLPGEVGDLCQAMQIDEAGHRLQRIWSNASAADGGAPCVPALPEPFYSASLTPQGPLSISAGSSSVLTVQGWSTSAVSDWSLTYRAFAHGVLPTVTLDATVLNNGGTATATVSVPVGAPSGAQGLVFVYSSRSTTDISFWPVLIQVP
jgi:hypothetical protein